MVGKLPASKIVISVKSLCKDVTKLLVSKMPNSFSLSPRASTFYLLHLPIQV